MKNALNISAVVLSTSLLSWAVFGDYKNVLHPVEQTKNDILEVLSGKENMNSLLREIKNNTREYHIQKNDTITSVAAGIGISTTELVDLNSFLGKPLLRRWKNRDRILIRAGEDIFMPKDLTLFRAQIDRIAEYSQVDKQNKKVQNGEMNKMEIEPIFASSVRSIRLPNLLSGFIRSQQISYDPNHPRVVDRQWQRQVTCANAMRTLMGQSMNFTDLSSKELAFQTKQNVDAWMLPTELMKIGYIQEFPEIMDMFDPRAIGSIDPIKKEKLGEYQEAIRALYKRLEQGGDALVWSFVPYYFKRSHYKNVVGDYNQTRKDKHYNTHQSIFAGNATMQFGAWNVPLVKDGKMETFWADKKNIRAEITQLKEAFVLETKSADAAKKILLSDHTKNPEIAKKLTRYVKAFEPLLNSIKWLEAEEKKSKQEQLFVLLNEWNETKSPIILEKIQKITPKYRLTSESLEYIGSFVSHHNDLKHFIQLLQKSAASGQIIDGQSFGLTIGENETIQQAIKQYNAPIEGVQKTKIALAKKEALLEKPDKGISVIDFILNFIQSRADFGGSLSDGYRKDILQGLSIYGDLLHIEIDGKPVDIMQELGFYKANQKMNMMVFPEQTFKITGPMMVDGEKQSTHPDIVRQQNMNIRTRFLFEFLASYLPTELLTPGKNSSYTRGDESSHMTKLTIKGVYGLSLKYDEHWELMRNKHNQVLSENIEEVLLREIVKYENLNLADPKFKEKLQRFYALQIKALQMAGFIQDENTLNRSAVNINRAIPYFDSSSINEIFMSYIKMKKYEIHAEDTRLAEMKNFITIRTLPGDTYRQIFTTIAKYASVLGEASERYPYIRELSRLPDYKKRIFVERFLASASRERGFDASKFLENPKPFKNFIVSLDILETILADMADIRYMDFFPWLSETDQKVIELVSMDESYRQMLSNILAVESYGETWKMFSRRNLKKLVNNFWLGKSSGDYQLRISSLLASLEKNKTLEISMENILRTFRDTKVQSFLDSFDSNIKIQIQKDLEHIEVVSNLLSTSKGAKLSRKLLYDELSSVLRFDAGDGSNVVGKIVSATLLIDKLALHSEKLDYMLISAGYDLSSLFDDPDFMREYERTIIRINNLPENHMLLALTENFVIRLAESLTGSEIVTETVFDESFFSKWKYLGQIKYDKSVFQRHLKDYRKNIGMEKNNPKIEFFLKKLDTLIVSLRDNPGHTNENIYTFLRDKELRRFLETEDIEARLIPLEEEWNKDSFRSSVFHYVNKIEILRKKIEDAQEINSLQIPEKTK